MDIELTLIDFLEDDAGALINPRGQIHDTSDLQGQLAQDGQQVPVLLWRQNSGRFYVKDGHRRITAARALGWKTVRADIVEDDGDPLLAMLVTHSHENIAPSAWGRALRTLVETRQLPLVRVAKSVGMKPARAQLYIDLTEAPPTVQARVDAGEISLSAWREVRYKTKAMQLEVAAMEKPTIRAIRQMNKPENGASSLSQQFDALPEIIAAANSLRRLVARDADTLDIYTRAKLLVIMQQIMETLEHEKNSTLD